MQLCDANFKLKIKSKTCDFFVRFLKRTEVTVDALNANGLTFSINTVK